MEKLKKDKIKKLILKILLIVVIIGCLIIGGYFILKACGFTTAEDFERLKATLGDSFLFWLVIGLLQIFQVIFLPITNQIITVPLALTFPTEQLWKVWLCSWISIWVATIILYFIGRFGGSKILKWLLGDQEQVDKCTYYLNRGWIFYPVCMLLPLPDDIVTILAGTSNMNIWFVFISSFITRAVDVACSVWGIGYLTRLGWWGWIILAVGIILLAFATFVFWKIDKKIRLKKNV